MALSEVHLRRQLHFTWDLQDNTNQINKDQTQDPQLDPLNYVVKLGEILQFVQSQVTATSHAIHDQNAKRQPAAMELNSLVWCNNHPLSKKGTGFSAALAKRREGPYVVTAVPFPNVREIRKDGWTKPTLVHVADLRPYRTPGVPGLPTTPSTRVQQPQTHYSLRPSTATVPSNPVATPGIRTLV